MADSPIHVYLNDHLAGATAGKDLAAQAAERHDGELGEFFTEIAGAISGDYNTLTTLIDQMGAAGSGGKEAVAKAGSWMSEDKFSGDTVGDPAFGTFITLETLCIGVEGKLCMWKALKLVEDEHPELKALNLELLIDSAQSQRDRLESKRLEVGRSALSSGKVSA